MIRIKNISILTFEEGKPEIKVGDILIKDDLIKEVRFGTDNGADCTPGDAEYVIDGKNRLAIPGLVNAHTHAYMTLFRNCADDVAFDEWLFKRISPLEDAMLPEDAYIGTKLAHIEMLRTGTTSYVDMHMTPGLCAKAVKESGIRAVLTRGLVGPTRDDEGAVRRLSEAKQEFEQWNDNNLLRFMLAPHAPYTCGPDFLRKIAEEAVALGLGINIHLAEGQNEINNLREQYGQTPIEYADAAGIFEVPCIAAHCVYLSDGDYDILRDKKVSVALNPASNMKLANGFAPVPLMLERGVRLCIGTDGAASNNTLNMFREMALTGLIHKGTTKNPETAPAAEIIKMATVNGAAAIGMSECLGQIKEGYKADICILNLDMPQFCPRSNLVSALTYSCNGSEVETVIIDGKIVMEKREIKTIDEEKVYYEVNKIADRYGINK